MSDVIVSFCCCCRCCWCYFPLLSNFSSTNNNTLTNPIDVKLNRVNFQAQSYTRNGTPYGNENSDVIVFVFITQCMINNTMERVEMS